ncbi:MAG TPA: protein kinase [Actinomycetaceae bacterium]|nr:protein kinase [Actinomycetaceae bacterium]
MDSIGGYRLVRQLGSGGMGTVWEALDGDGNAVALKLLHPHIAADAAARRRLEREVGLLHRVKGPRVSRVLDADVDGTDGFVVTELIDGPTLEEDVTENGPFLPKDLTSLARGLAEALKSIHEVDVVHRDLKPSNVMMSKAGPVIIDFGIAQLADDVRLTQTGLVTGTPGYLDPEIVDGKDPTPVADWWAWAAVLVFAATGRHPFGSGSNIAVFQRLHAGAVDVEGLEPETAAVFRGALRPESGARLGPDTVLGVLERRISRAELTRLLAGIGLDGEGKSRTGGGGSATVPPIIPPAPRGAGAPAPPVPMQGAPQSPRDVSPYGEGQYPASTGWSPGHPVPASAEQREQLPQWLAPPASRTGMVAATGALLAAAGAVWPGAVIVVFASLLILLAGVGFGADWLRRRRMRHGHRRGDTARAVVAAPWHLIRGALLAVFLMAVGLGLGYLAVQVIQLAVGRGIVPNMPNVPDVWIEYLVMGAGTLVVLLASWFAPGGRRAREGARIFLGNAFPYPVMRGIFVAICLLLTFGLAIGAVAGMLPATLWDPLPEPVWL